MRQEGGLGRLRGTIAVVGKMAIGERLMRGRGEGGHQAIRALGQDAVGDLIRSLL